MERDISRLRSCEYDVVIIGGGIYGVSVARDAALRGLSVVLVEQGDFGHATSANSLKVIHGGFRDLKKRDVAGVRKGILERKAFMRNAPHLVHPMQVVIPTYGHGGQGREVFSCALRLYDLIGFDRNSGIGHKSVIPHSRMISREECLKRIPGLDESGLTGAALFYDAQVSNTDRLTLSCLKSAVEKEACVINYCEVTSFVMDERSVKGVHVKDLVGGEHFVIRAKIVVNTSGPWMNQVWGLLGKQMTRRISLAKAMNIVTRPIVKDFAFGLRGPQSERYWFFTPWKGHSVIGTSEAVYSDHPNTLSVSEGDVQNILEEVNEAYPALSLTQQDILWVHRGLVPAESSYPLLDHEMADHVSGLISVVGVKYTASRRVAEEVVDQIFYKLNRPGMSCTTAETPVWGGDIDSLDPYIKDQVHAQSSECSSHAVQRLVRIYGTHYTEVLNMIHEEPHLGQPLTKGSLLTQGEIIYALRKEMAVHLSDIVLRRTELGALGHPGKESLEACARLVAHEKKWAPDQMHVEIEELEKFLCFQGDAR